MQKLIHPIIIAAIPALKPYPFTKVAGQEAPTSISRSSSHYYCSNCGGRVPFNVRKKYLKYAGKERDRDGNYFCPHCGARIIFSYEELDVPKVKRRNFLNV